MSAAEKLLERMRRPSSGWKPKDFEALFRGFGFEMDEGGNHTTYIHATYSDMIFQVPRHKSLSNFYARETVKLIDRLREREAENADK